ncbi:aminotransferase class I/II-fold pyridoxal phosphate-dependent enzyme [Halogeometricum borinquense]|uniref:Aminotransferase n=1 Tax=Halogeometricum borinquense TaxID=60847 RepID=A0A6C0UEK6_9EURY|nr:aminotransferase class I/II-fold pyridoxal phosphate-dependent enzyme [Halogeometricum borinquense]QIB73866.1 aminotransferase class I/II-fold pyridoxal phosphate-dependent enzyme [Halogeometricum borinquense]QIQ76772.1 aminotransferase class I/II-fold pyridoxal phosphate-dependent enzyme [Halogeometricum borinquense]
MSDYLSTLARETPPSGIRRFFEVAEEMDDVISLGVGEPDFSAPWAARTAAIDSLERGRTSYTSNRGMRELREAIAGRVERYDQQYDPDDEILVTAGASEAVDLAMRALVDTGDIVAVPEPSYISYEPTVSFAGGEALSVPTRAEADFAVGYDDLERAGAADADVLVLCYPNNPTGAVMTRDELADVAEFAREHDLFVLSDEIYAALRYEDDHVSIATLPEMRERTVVFNGFSKAYAMTGLRLGYALGPSAVIDAMNRIHQYTMLSAPTTAQYAALEAIESCDDAVDEMRRAYDRRRRFVISRFNDIGMDCFEAKGAFYVFPKCPPGWEDDEAFAEALLQEEKVALVPGRVFGESGEGHLRVSYATSMSELKTALNRIESFVCE